MSKTAFTMTGIEDLLNKVDALPNKLTNKVLRQVLRGVVKPFAADVKGDLPKASGEMERGLKVESGKRKQNAIRLNVSINVLTMTKFYASFVELGTKKMAGRGTMRGNLKREGNQLVKTIEKGIVDGLNRIVKEG